MAKGKKRGAIKTDAIRTNIRISKRLKLYFEEESRATGISQSGLMQMALQEYVDQKNVIKFTRELSAMGLKVDEDGQVKIIK